MDNSEQLRYILWSSLIDYTDYQINDKLSVDVADDIMFKLSDPVWFKIAGIDNHLCGLITR